MCLYLESSPKKIRALIGYKRNTELALAVDVMMARSKGIYVLMIKVNKFPFSYSRLLVF